MNKEKQLVFVDFIKAFDCVNRMKQWGICSKINENLLFKIYKKEFFLLINKLDWHLFKWYLTADVLANVFRIFHRYQNP